LTFIGSAYVLCVGGSFTAVRMSLLARSGGSPV
jgi:hypothetical protein